MAVVEPAPGVEPSDRARRRTARALRDHARPLQAAAADRLHRRDAARSQRQALQAHAARPLLGRARARHLSHALTERPTRGVDRMARVPIEEGYFRIPDDPAEPPRAARQPVPELRRGVLPAADGVRASACTRAPTTSTCSTRGTLWTWTYCESRCSGRRTPTCPATASGRSTSPEGPRIQAILLGGPDDFEIGMELELDLETLRHEPRRRRGRDLPVPAGRRQARDAARAEVRGRRGRRHRDGALRHAARVPAHAHGTRRGAGSRCTTRA